MGEVVPLFVVPKSTEMANSVLSQMIELSGMAARSEIQGFAFVCVKPSGETFVGASGSLGSDNNCAAGALFKAAMTAALKPE